jgi:hypothetical protein
MDEHYQKLKEYFQYHRQQGVDPGELRKGLVQQGWDEATIDRAIQDTHPASEASTAQPATLAQDQSDAQHTASPVSGPVLPEATPKYKVFTALMDTVVGIRRNALTYFASAVIAFVAAIILIGIVGALVGQFILTKLTSVGGSVGSFFITILAIALIAGAFLSLAATLIQIVTNLALNEGADGRKSTIKHTLRSGVGRIGKVLVTNFIVGLVVIGPLLAITIISLVILFTQRKFAGSGTGMMIIILLLQLISIIWLVLGLLRYSLAPVVAMFEPNVSAWKTLARSSQLLGSMGKLFVFKGVLLILLILVITAAITGQTLKELQNSNNPWVNVEFIIVNIFANGAMVMLYRNRRMVKDKPAEH